MKKYLLIFLSVFSLFFITDNVFAQSYGLNGGVLNFDGSASWSNNLVSTSSYGVKLTGISSSIKANAVRFYFARGQGVIRGTYDVTFYINLTLYNTYSINSTSVSGIPCSGTLQGPIINANSETAPQIRYICKDVPIDTTLTDNAIRTSRN